MILEQGEPEQIFTRPRARAGRRIRRAHLQPSLGAWSSQRLLFSFFNADVASRYWPDILYGMWVTTYLGLA